MIFVVDISTVIVFVLSCLGFAFASTALTIAMEWLFSHMLLTVILFVAFLIISALVKTAASIKDGGKASAFTGLVFNILTAAVELCFMFGYILPTWIYSGGFYAMGETIASIVLFFLAGIIGKSVISTLLRWTGMPMCAACGIADFIAKSGTFAAFYFLLDGLSCYLFDYLGIAAPLV